MSDDIFRNVPRERDYRDHKRDVVAQDVQGELTRLHRQIADMSPEAQVRFLNRYIEDHHMRPLGKAGRRLGEEMGDAFASPEVKVQHRFETIEGNLEGRGMNR